MRILTLDLFFRDLPGLIAAYLVENAGELAIIETGPASTLPRLRAALQEHGIDERDIRKVFVTHIHLDHSGAAGWFAQQGAAVYCHANAARHLTQPARLIESARQVYGSAFDSLWGETLPAPADKVIVLNDGESVPIGDATLTAWDTPGHARHHHAYVLGDTCFTGDVAGMRLQGTRYQSVTAAPPQFDPSAYVQSVDRILAAGFSSLRLTHFGIVENVSEYLRAYRSRITEVHATVAAWHEAGHSPQAIRELYHDKEHRHALAAGLTEEDWLRCEAGNSTAMCADGLLLSCIKSKPSAP